jgi:hypothetical protein
MDNFQLKAVSLMECYEASESDLDLFAKEGGPATAYSTGGAKPAEEDEDAAGDEPAADETGAAAEPKNKEDIAIRCEPILDPVKGLAMNELTVGDSVMTRLPADSVFFKLMARNIAGFDGVIAANVTGILQNELGTATISLALSDGIMGVMKLSGKVRVKTAGATAEAKRKPGPHSPLEIPPGAVFGAAGIVVFLSLLAMLFYILK